MKVNQDVPVDVVLLTALDEERDAVIDHFRIASGTVESAIDGYDIASLPTSERGTLYRIAVASPFSMGNINAALAAERSIKRWHPAHVVLTGITGGVKDGDKRYLGDVLVADQIVAYEPGKQTPTKLERRYEVYRPSRVLLEAARRLRPEAWVHKVRCVRPDGSTGRVLPLVHFGVIASGEKVVRDPKLIEELQSDWSLLAGVEMEGAGAALAAFMADQVGMLLVKGISDWADPAKGDSWRDCASQSAVNTRP